MALASLCREVTRPGKQFSRLSNDIPSFTAFIVDHQLRDESTAEANNVSKELSRLGIASKVLQLDWSQHGSPASLPNFESVARRLRFQALGRACRDHDITTLLLAHHRDDQAETILARIVSGYGGSGLRGIKQETAIAECSGIYGVDYSGKPVNSYAGSRHWHPKAGIRMESGGVRVARPLLPFDKGQLIAICEQNGVHWFEDHTNSDVTLTQRNTIRSLLNHNVVPRALQKDRLIALARSKFQQIQDREVNASAGWEQIRYHLDFRSGTATYRVPRSLTSPSVEQKPTYARLLQHMVEVVSPKDDVPIIDLHDATEYVFGSEEHSEPVSPDTANAKRAIVGGVSIREKAMRTQPKHHRVFTFCRSNPPQAERKKQKVNIWPPLSKSIGASWSQWYLWDKRYWIRVCPPKHTDSSGIEVMVRFLSEDDVAHLRKTLPFASKAELERALDFAPGDRRYTCPALVIKSQADRQFEEAGEQVVALPSLGWSWSGWQRSTDFTSETSWCWDIRYKHVKLGISTETL
jgi:tRNA(Ile)-lysidine synthase